MRVVHKQNVQYPMNAVMMALLLPVLKVRLWCGGILLIPYVICEMFQTVYWLDSVNYFLSYHSFQVLPNCQIFEFLTHQLTMKTFCFIIGHIYTCVTFIHSKWLFDYSENSELVSFINISTGALCISYSTADLPGDKRVFNAWAIIHQ